MRATSDITSFEFHFVTGGNPAWGKRQGAIGTALTLDDTTVPWDGVADTTTRGNRMILVLAGGVQLGPKAAKYLIDGNALVIQPKGVDARTLEKAIDRKSSAREAEVRRAALVAQGQGHLVRSVICPVCKATVDLSGLEKSKYSYCRFCESVFSEEGGSVTDGRVHRLCDDCGMFDRIQDYPEFYFYFLLVVYGFRYNKRYLCDACAHRLFLKALGINFIFVLGVPTAIWVKVKSLQGRQPTFAELAEANKLARRGLFRDAAAIYDRMLRAHPNHPALLTNLAQGHLQGGDTSGAAKVLAQAIASCSSYLPAHHLAQAGQPAQA